MPAPTPPAIAQEARRAFLDALAEGRTISGACRAAFPGRPGPRPGYRTLLDWRKHPSPEGRAFAAEWEAAEAAGLDVIRAEISRRAISGWSEPVFQKGEQAVDAEGRPAVIRKYSDRMLELLSRRLPELRSEKTVNVNLNDGSRLTISLDDMRRLTPEQQLQMRDLVRAMRDARLARGIALDGDGSAAPALPAPSEQPLDVEFSEVSELDKLAEIL